MDCRRLSSRLALPAICAAALLLPALARAQQESSAGQPAAAQAAPALAERIEVTATRVPEDVEAVPASVTVITGDEIAARGATDLTSALALVAGVAIAPGGDNGPAGSVPELWGLREFDAFLLVVDGVPWGGAFNPALTTLDLTNVDRIEVLRGSAPVMFGATSFVGVIHVIHRAAGAAGAAARVFGGSYGSGGAAVALPLPGAGAYQQSLTVDGQKEGFKDDRADYRHGHLLYRGRAQTTGGVFRLDFDTAITDQKPASPIPVVDGKLSPLVPLDTNENFLGAKIDESRYHLVGGYDRNLALGAWSTTVAVTRTDRTSARGFLTGVTTDDPNANGFRQDLTLDDIYFDSHIAGEPRPGLRVVAGVDHLYGHADQHSGDFDYFVNLDGSHPPSLADLPAQGDLRLKDDRNFSGLYLQAEWSPTARWKFQLGGRLNHTVETLETSQREVEEPPAPFVRDDKTVTRGSGVAGLSWLAWQRGNDGVWLYGDYRDTFKAAALDFGPDADAEILNPETAQSYEAGAKGVTGNLDWELSAFQMDFSHLVVTQIDSNGLPRLVNAGQERFRGAELEADYKLRSDLRWRLGYSLHDARFEDFVSVFDAGPTQVRGNQLVLSARNMVSTGLLYFPAQGWNGSILYNWVDKRFLDEENTASAPSYSTWSASLGYRFGKWGIRLEGYNLNDTRPAVSISELGDGQVYVLPARSFRLSLDTRF